MSSEPVCHDLVFKPIPSQDYQLYTIVTISRVWVDHEIHKQYHISVKHMINIRYAYRIIYEYIVNKKYNHFNKSYFINQYTKIILNLFMITFLEMNTVLAISTCQNEIVNVL